MEFVETTLVTFDLTEAIYNYFPHFIGIGAPVARALNNKHCVVLEATETIVNERQLIVAKLEFRVPERPILKATITFDPENQWRIDTVDSSPPDGSVALSRRRVEYDEKRHLGVNKNFPIKCELLLDGKRFKEYEVMSIDRSPIDVSTFDPATYGFGNLTIDNSFKIRRMLIYVLGAIGLFFVYSHFQRDRASVSKANHE